MGKKQNTFTDKEKINIALKAVEGGEEELKRLAEEHNIPETKIKEWIRENDLESVNDEIEEVSLEANDSFIDSVKYGVTKDILNYSRLTFWTVFGTAVLIVFITSVMFIHEYTRTASLQYQSDRSQFYSIQELQSNDLETLESFGVVNPEEGIYRIPVDSAITIIANELE